MDNLNSLKIYSTSITSIWWIIIFIVSFSLFFILLVLEYLHLRRGQKIQKQNIKENNIRIYTYDYQNDFLFHLDKSNMSNHRQTSINWLINSFVKEDQPRLTLWLNELKKENTIVPPHFTGNVRLSKNRHHYYNILNVTSINYEKKIIHFESKLCDFPRVKIFKNNFSVALLSYNELLDLYLENQNSPKTCFLIKINNKVNNVHYVKKINYSIITGITIDLLNTIKGNTIVTNLQDDEILVLNFDKNSRSEAYQFAKKIDLIVSKKLLLSSNIDSYSSNIGITIDNDQEYNLLDIISLSRKMADYCYTNPLGTNIVIYNKSNDYSNKEQQNIISNVKSILRYNNLSIEYCPILDVKTKRIAGYNTNVIVKNDLIHSSDQLQDNAVTDINVLQKVITEMTKKIDAPFEKSSLPSSLASIVIIRTKINYFQEIISSQLDYTAPKKLINVFTFTDADILNDPDYSYKVLKELISKKIKCGLIVTSPDLSVPSYLMELFNVFFIDLAIMPNISATESITFIDLFNHLKSHKKLIMALNASSWAIIEYIIKIGIKYISSSLLSINIDCLPTIDDKKIRKIEGYLKHN